MSAGDKRSHGLLTSPVIKSLFFKNNSETSTAENDDTAGPGQHVLPGVAGGLGQLQPVGEGQS